MGLKDFFINPCCKTWQDRMKQKDAIIDKQANEIAALREDVNKWQSLAQSNAEGWDICQKTKAKLLTGINEDATDD